MVVIREAYSLVQRISLGLICWQAHQLIAKESCSQKEKSQPNHEEMPVSQKFSDGIVEAHTFHASLILVSRYELRGKNFVGCKRVKPRVNRFNFLYLCGQDAFILL